MWFIAFINLHVLLFPPRWCIHVAAGNSHLEINNTQREMIIVIMHNLRLHSCFSFPIKIKLHSEYALNHKDGGTIAFCCCGRTALSQAVIAQYFLQRPLWDIFPILILDTTPVRVYSMCWHIYWRSWVERRNVFFNSGKETFDLSECWIKHDTAGETTWLWVLHLFTALKTIYFNSKCGLAVYDVVVSNST